MALLDAHKKSINERTFILIVVTEFHGLYNKFVHVEMPSKMRINQVAGIVKRLMHLYSLFVDCLHVFFIQSSKREWVAKVHATVHFCKLIIRLNRSSFGEQHPKLI